MFERLKHAAAMFASGVGLKESLSVFEKDEKGQMDVVLMVVTGAITVLIGVIIFVNVKVAMPAVNDSAANATMDSVTSIFYSSISLVIIGFLVLAAVFILSVVGQLRGGT